MSFEGSGTSTGGRRLSSAIRTSLLTSKYSKTSKISSIDSDGQYNFNKLVWLLSWVLELSELLLVMFYLIES